MPETNSRPPSRDSPRCRSAPLDLRPSAEALESRSCPSLAFEINYSLDVNHFFDTPQKQAALQFAADSIASRLNDSLAAIVPGDGNSWTAEVTDPSTGGTVDISDPTIPADTIVVYAGGRSLPAGGELGQGGFGGYSDSGSTAWIDLVTGRGRPLSAAGGALEFVPWGGSVAFDSSSNWYFGTDPAGLIPGQYDFLSVASHELFHLLGFGTSPEWSGLVSGGGFHGPDSIATDGGVVPGVSPDGGHWAQGTTSAGSNTLMEPSILTGTRELPTPLDFAALADIGWDLDSDPGSTIAQAEDLTSLALGNQAIAGLVIGPDPTDVRMYKITGSAGEVLSVTTLPDRSEAVIPTELRIFDATGKELKAVDAGLSGGLSLTLPADGAFYLGVSGEGNAAYSPVNELSGRVVGSTGVFDLSLGLDPPSAGTADLSLSSSAPSQSVQGSPILVVATILNEGPDAAGSTFLVETLPPSVEAVEAVPNQGTASVVNGVLTVDFGTLASGGSAFVRITVTSTVATTLNFSGSVSAAQPDPVAANNTTSASTLVSAAAMGPVAGVTSHVTIVPPVITSVRLASTGKGARKIMNVVLVLNEALDPGSVIGAAFSLTKPKPGRHRRGQAPPRVPVRIKAISYSPANPLVVTITPAIKGAWPKGMILAISGTAPTGLRDLAGTQLDGDGDGRAGGDLRLSIS